MVLSIHFNFFLMSTRGKLVFEHGHLLTYFSLVSDKCFVEIGLLFINLLYWHNSPQISFFRSAIVVVMFLFIIQ